MRQSIIIYGGSFDPVHAQHIAVAQAARDQLGAEKVLVVPAWQSPLKGGSGASFEQRLAWCQTAFDDLTEVEVIDIEARLPKPSYTINLVQAIHDMYPDHDLWLVIGSDNQANFHSWHRWRELRAMVKIATAPRPGHTEEVNPGLIDYSLNLAGSSLSSTELRTQLGRGVIPEQLPVTVQAALTRHNPYFVTS